MDLKADLDLPRNEMGARRIAELGVALFDRACHPIAMDDGAASILSAISNESRCGDAFSPSEELPRSLIEHVRLVGLDEPALKEVRFIAAEHCYSARACLIQSGKAAIAGPWIVLRFERDAQASDALAELSITCGLTEREREALSAIAIGLTSKEVAQRMKISPSTVKVFLRLIKIKTGARNRADIVARLLDPRDRSGHYQDFGGPAG